MQVEPSQGNPVSSAQMRRRQEGPSCSRGVKGAVWRKYGSNGLKGQLHGSVIDVPEEDWRWQLPRASNAPPLSEHSSSLRLSSGTFTFSPSTHPVSEERQSSTASFPVISESSGGK
jgi:hypothetical protein